MNHLGRSAGLAWHQLFCYRSRGEWSHRGPSQRETGGKDLCAGLHRCRPEVGMFTFYTAWNLLPILIPEVPSGSHFLKPYAPPWDTRFLFSVFFLLSCSLGNDFSHDTGPSIFNTYFLSVPSVWGFVATWWTRQTHSHPHGVLIQGRGWSWAWVNHLLVHPHHRWQSWRIGQD